ncbi:MAG: hypothetical protein H6Q03_1442 [Acidobacteria bacterium]|nr:hypothetical protein [Acidobacteriota bacterium]
MNARAALAALALLAAAPAPAQEPDPFYLDLERSGQLALAHGDAPAAARKLRIACFGMLDRPERLAACLVRLAVAQARGEDRAGFLATFDRLDGVEERFRAYRAAPLERAEREEFEQRLGAWLEPALLAGRPAFAAASSRGALAAAEAALARGEPAEALARLEGVPIEVEDGRAGCLRGEAHARMGRCDAAQADFAACHPELEARFAAPALGCLAELGLDEEAWRLSERLSPEVRDEREVRRRLGRLPARAP